MGITARIALAFLVGIGIMLFGVVIEQDKYRRKILIIVGAALSACSVAVVLFLMFVLMPAM